MLDLLEGDRVPFELGGDGAAHELVAVVDPDLGGVAGVVADGDVFPDVGGEHGRQVAGAVEPHPVALHASAGRGTQQQQVEVVGVCGQAWDPSAGGPPLDRRLAGLGMDASVVLLDHESLNRGVEDLEGERRFGDWASCGAVGDVAGQVRQQLVVDAAEQPLDLASPSWDADARVDQLHVGVEADLLEPGAGEVAAVVAVEGVRQAGDRPGGVGLGPYGLVQGEGGLFRRRGAEEQRVAGEGPGVVVEDHGQPWSGRCASGVEDGEVEQGVVALPLVVRAVGDAPVDQLETVPVGTVSVEGEGPQAGVEPGDDAADGGVARDRPAAGGGGVGDSAVDEGCDFDRFVAVFCNRSMAVSPAR